MIKLIITNVEFLDPTELKATANYLNELAKLKEKESEVIEPCPGDFSVHLSSTNLDNGEITEHGKISGFAEEGKDIARETMAEFMAPGNKPYFSNLPNMPCYIPEKHNALTEFLKSEENISNELNTPPQLPDTFKPIKEIPTATTDKDAAGLPWDARIHVSTKTKTAKGKWKYKVNLDRDFIKSVEDELRVMMGIPTPPPTAAPSVLSVPIANISYPALMLKVTQAIRDNKLTQNQYVKVLNDFGITNPMLISTRVDLMPAIDAKLTEIIGG